jgi:hypothetical protein
MESDPDLTTGTFNLVVKEPIAIRLSGASARERAQARILELMRLTAVADPSRKPFNVTANCCSCQPANLTG